MTSVAPEERIWDLLRGALATRALGLVASLDVATALGDGAKSVGELAAATGADADALRRLLRALASEGVFAEDEPGVFRNTESSGLLAAGGGWREFAVLFGGIWHRAVGGLEADGKAVFASTFGQGFWPWLAEHPHERALFDEAMGQGQEGRLERLRTVEWRGDETVVDVGGGNGSLLAALRGAYPGIHGIVFDLPETVRDASLFGEHLEFVAGSFFDTVPGGADVYLLVTILHDWDDDSALAILQTVRRAARADSRLLVLDAVVPPGNDQFGAKWLDLLMLALFAGRERDEPQWRALLDAGGFEPIRFHERLIEARCRS
jgi:SAM-dependent methyltransferase